MSVRKHERQAAPDKAQKYPKLNCNHDHRLAVKHFTIVKNMLLKLNAFWDNAVKTKVKHNILGECRVLHQKTKRLRVSK
jgi:hypothetical protein